MITFPCPFTYPEGYASHMIKAWPSMTCKRVGRTTPLKSMPEMEQLQKSGTESNYEEVAPTDVGKPYFDWEMYYDHELSAHELDNILAGCYEVFKEMFKSVEGFEPFSDVATSTCHGWVQKDGGMKFKASFHFVLLPLKMRFGKGKALYEHFAHILRKDAGWDNSVYPDESPRLWRMVGSIKTMKDRRPVIPCTSTLARSVPFFDHVVQFLHGYEEDIFEVLKLHEDKSKTRRDPEKKRLSLLPVTAAARPEWLTISDAEMNVEALKRLQEKGLVDNISARHVKYYDGYAEVYFTTLSSRKCLSHYGTHDSNNFVVKFKRDGTMAYFCFSDQPSCKKEVALGSWKMSPAKMFSFDACSPQDLSEYSPMFLAKLAAQFKELSDVDKKAYSEEYKSFLLSYSNRFFCFMKGSVPEVVEEFFDEGGNLDYYVRRTVNATSQVHSNTNGAFSEWLRNPGRRTKVHYGYYVEDAMCPEKEYNLFGGSLQFARWPSDPLTEAEMSDIQPVLDAFLNQLCEGNAEQYDYVMNWLGHKLSKPGEKLGTMLWFCGPQGSGKGLLLNNLIGRGVFGKAYMQVSTLNHLTGNFNSLLQGKILVNIDDAELHQGKEQSESLKALITEPEMVLEAKYKDAVVVPNIVDLIGCSNKSEPVMLDLDDRRMVMNMTSSKHAQDLEYWEPLVDLIFRQKTPMLMFRYLKNRDLSAFKPARIPSTKLKEDLKFIGRQPLVVFLQYMCERKVPGVHLADSVPYVLVDELYEHYAKVFMKTWFKQLTPVNPELFIRKLNALEHVLPGFKLSRTTREGKSARNCSHNAEQLEQLMREKGQWFIDM